MAASPRDVGIRVSARLYVLTPGPRSCASEKVYVGGEDPEE